VCLVVDLACCHMRLVAGDEAAFIFNHITTSLSSVHCPKTRASHTIDCDVKSDCWWFVVCGVCSVLCGVGVVVSQVASKARDTPLGVAHFRDTPILRSIQGNCIYIFEIHLYRLDT
jgi:hypothetical protein